MISYAQAQTILLENAHLGNTISVPLAAAGGKIVATPYLTSCAIPSFNNSAMDGFAVRREDCHTATPKTPVILPVHHITAAGTAQARLHSGNAVQIMTGAVVPHAADAIIPIEDVTVERNNHGVAITIRIVAPPALQQHIRQRGEDFPAAAALAVPGTRITPRHIMAFSAAGIAAILVRQPPETIVLATGNEIIEATEKLTGTSAIYNANSPYLLAIGQAAGLTPRYAGIIPDTEADFMRVLAAILEKPSTAPRLILSTGAVSKGDFDFVPAALHAIGATTLFHRVAIKPGKPLLFARLPNGDYFFGLPGNPISSAVGFRFFVMPLLRAILGLPPEPPLTARLTTALTGKSGLYRFLKAHLTLTAGGAMTADILPGQESFKISPMLQANGWIALDESIANLPTHSLVSCFSADPFLTMDIAA
jgi:molybdopterin molybdotransferase